MHVLLIDLTLHCVRNPDEETHTGAYLVRSQESAFVSTIIRGVGEIWLPSEEVVFIPMRDDYKQTCIRTKHNLLIVSGRFHLNTTKEDFDFHALLRESGVHVFPEAQEDQELDKLFQTLHVIKAVAGPHFRKYRIPIIKAIRQATGVGLSEAKGVTDRLLSSDVIEVSSETRECIKKNLQDFPSFISSNLEVSDVIAFR